LYVLIAIILILLLLIMHRLYLAYYKGLNFFDPARKNVKFNAHSKFAAELFSFAQETGVDANVEHGGQNSVNDMESGDNYRAHNDEYNEEEHPDL